VVPLSQGGIPGEGLMEARLGREGGREGRRERKGGREEGREGGGFCVLNLENLIKVSFNLVLF